MHLALITFLTLVLSTAAAPQPPEGKAGGFSIPISKRSSLVNEDKTISVEALRSQIATTRAKILRGFENFERNVGTAHPSALKGEQKRWSGAEALTSVGNKIWCGNLYVGRPPDLFFVDFDTSSSDILLPGTGCVGCVGNSYDPSASSTSQDLGKSYTVNYLDGSSVNIQEYTDMISIVGPSVCRGPSPVATKYTTNPSSDLPPDGVLGMAFQQLSAANQSPLFQTLVSQSEVTNPVFAFKLAPSGGELYIGGVNSDLYTGSFSYAPVTQIGFWQVNMDSIQGNGQTMLSNVNSIIDTASVAIIGIPSQVQSLVNSLGGQPAPSSIGDGYYTFPCMNFPSINLTFGGTSFPIYERVLNLGPISSELKDCLFGIVGQNTASSFWIIGDVFLQSVYTMFDVGNTQIGFATLAED